MIRRSTLVFLTCLAALGTPALRSQPAMSAVPLPQAASDKPMLIAQASGGTQTRELGLNSKGEAVKELQNRLQKNGYYKGRIDGIYGLATQRAVSAFQQEADLEKTGTVDDKTYQKLRSASEGNTTGSAAANATGNTAGGVAGDDSAEPEADAPRLETAPTASELPDIEGGEVLIVDGAEDGGLGKVFGIGLGISAVLASFGIGFFIANRDKGDQSQEGEWGEIEPSADQPDTAASLSMTQPAGGAGRPANYANGNGSIGATNGAMTPVVPSLPTSGQMGGTSTLGKVDIIDGLIGDLRNPDPAQRRKAIWELGQRGNSIAMQPLVDSMVDADSKEKSLVLAALSEIGIRSLKPMSRALAIALQDDNPEVRKNAIRDLTRVYDLVVQISQMLGHATEDEDPEVRQTATWALAQLNRIRQSHDDDPNIRTFSGGGGGGPSGPIDLLSSEASLRRSQQGL